MNLQEIENRKAIPRTDHFENDQAPEIASSDTDSLLREEEKNRYLFKKARIALKRVLL